MSLGQLICDACAVAEIQDCPSNRICSGLDVKRLPKLRTLPPKIPIEMHLKKRSLWLILTLALLPLAQLRADSVTLKTGEEITGTIKSETDTEVTIDVQVSASITDERVIEKTDIAKIDKTQPDEIAYQQLMQTQPNPQSSLSSDEYGQIINNLTEFETAYPTSTHLDDVKKLAAAFEDEKKHVEAGQFKYLGRWIPQAEAMKRRVQIEAQELYGTMQQQAAAGDFIGAMQTFTSIDQAYKTTRSYPPAVTLAQAVLARLVPDLASRMAGIKSGQAQMKQTLLVTPEPERSNLIAQNKAEQDRAAAMLANSMRSGQRWVPLIPDSQASIQTLQRVASNDALRLSTTPVAAMEQSIAKVDAARASMDAHDYGAANVLLEQATSLWSQNEDARYALDQLKADVSTPTPTPTPKPSVTPRPRPSATPMATQEEVMIITPTPAPEKPFYMTIPGALGIVAVVMILIGVVAIVGKARARKDEVE